MLEQRSVLMKYQCNLCNHVFSVISDGDIKFAVCCKCGHGELRECEVVKAVKPSEMTEKMMQTWYEILKAKSTWRFVTVDCCGHSQPWKNGAEAPVVGALVWCIWCQKIGRVSKII